MTNEMPTTSTNIAPTSLRIIAHTPEIISRCDPHRAGFFPVIVLTRALGAGIFNFPIFSGESRSNERRVARDAQAEAWRRIFEKICRHADCRHPESAYLSAAFFLP